MSEKTFYATSDFKVGDEVWWFKISGGTQMMYDLSLRLGQVELVHDTIKEIKDDTLFCWYSVKKPHEVWGKTRKEAWETLKRDIEKWGFLD